MQTIRSFFDESGYVEIETPCLVPATVPEAHVDLVGADGGLLLQASPEPQMKRLLADGWNRIYQITRAFRAGEHGPWHNPEFTLLEWYRTGAVYDDLMGEAEGLVRRLYAAVGREPPPFARLAVDEAFSRWAGWKPSRTWDEERFFGDLVRAVEPAMIPLGAVFLHDYPAGASSLARIRPDDPSVCERFELYVQGIEIANGFTELTDAAEQRSRLEEANAERARRGRPAYPIDEKFLLALEAGLPPCAGIALGVDRVVAVILGFDSIADVMSFPRSRL